MRQLGPTVNSNTYITNPHKMLPAQYNYTILMNKFLDRTRNLIFARQTSMISSTLILASMLIVARFFGFLRYRTLATFFTTEQLDIFFAAFRIPDLVFEILITGALSTSFIPFFIKYQRNKESQSIHISSIINLIAAILIGAILLATIFLPQIMHIITPGFNAEKTRIS